MIAVARSADLVLMVLDGGKEQVNNHRTILERYVFGFWFCWLVGWVDGWVHGCSSPYTHIYAYDTHRELETVGLRLNKKRRQGSDCLAGFEGSLRRDVMLTSIYKYKHKHKHCRRRAGSSSTRRCP